MELIRNLKKWGITEYMNLMAFPKKNDHNSDDEPVWKLTSSEIFSVKSFYGHLIAGEVSSGDF